MKLATIFALIREPLKVCQHVLQVKKELKIGPSEFDFAESTVIFISESFCSYYKTLRSKCNKIQERKLIPSYFTSNGNIRYRIRKTLVSIQSIISQVFQKVLKNFPDIVINNFDNLIIIMFTFVFEWLVFEISLKWTL